MNQKLLRLVLYPRSGKMNDISLKTSLDYLNHNETDLNFFDKFKIVDSIESLSLPYYSRMPDLKKILIKNLSHLGCILNVHPNIGSKLKLSAISPDRQTAICVQMGNISNLSTDILKLNDAYEFKELKKAIIFLPTKKTELAFKSGNCAAFERVLERKDFYTRHLNLPACLCGIEVVN